jgi:hypothetical protein
MLSLIHTIKIMRILLVLLCLAIVYSGDPDQNGCTGKINLHDIVDSPPTLVKQITHGQKYTIGNHFFT